MEIFPIIGLILGLGLAAAGLLACLWIWAALIVAKRADNRFKIQKPVVDEHYASNR